MHTKILLCLTFAAFIIPAWADDSVEAAATGNVVFEKAPELVMQDETLTINKSANKNLAAEIFSIDVDFHFKNISNHDVTRKIAFVLPPVRCQMEVNSMWMGLDANTENEMSNNGLKDFSTTVDGKNQTFTIRKEAMLGQRNITDLLNKLQVPLNPCKIKMTNEGKPDPKYSMILEKNHLLTEANEMAWSENIYFEWTQIFPAGKVINIHHHYTPVIGESVLSPRSINDLNNEFANNKVPMNFIWNRNPETLSSTNPSIINTKNDLDGNNKQTRFCITPKWIQYNLTTGANWNGGIGVFKLIIKDDANAPFAVNEFYKSNDGVQISKNENMMTFTINKFIPTQNLFVLFLSLPQSKEDFQSCGM